MMPKLLKILEQSFLKKIQCLQLNPGYFIGSTLPKPTGDITSSTEKNYELKKYTDSEKGYKYCILEYTR